MKNIIIILNLFILFSCSGQTEKNEKKISSKKIFLVKKKETKVQFSKVNCIDSQNLDDQYNMNCAKFSLSNGSFELSGNRHELITIKFKNIEKAIIRKIDANDLLTSNVTVEYFKIKKHSSENVEIMYNPFGCLRKKKNYQNKPC